MIALQMLIFRHVGEQHLVCCHKAVNPKRQNSLEKVCNLLKKSFEKVYNLLKKSLEKVCNLLKKSFEKACNLLKKSLEKVLKINVIIC